VYDVADSLTEQGFLQVEEGEPKRYRSIPSAAIQRALRDRYESSLDALESALDEVEPVEPPDSEGCSVWSFSGRRSSLSRSWEIIEDADDCVWLLVSAGLLSPDCIEVLRAATERGVPITIASREDDVRDWLAGEIPDATVTTPPPALREDTGSPALDRLLVADGDTVLTVTRSQETPASPPEYVGTMGTGEQCGFVLTHLRLLESALADSPCL
jgi:hypothetical protein